MKLAQDTHDVDSKSTQKVYSFNQKEISETSLLNVTPNARIMRQSTEFLQIFGVFISYVRRILEGWGGRGTCSP